MGVHTWPDEGVTEALDAIYEIGSNFHCLWDYTAFQVTFDDADVTLGTDNINKVAHGFQTGMPVLLTQGTGALPTPLTEATRTWVIRIDDDNFKLASTPKNARLGTAIDLTALAGSATGHAVDTQPPGRRDGLEAFAAWEAANTSRQPFAPADSVYDSVDERAETPITQVTHTATGGNYSFRGTFQVINGLVTSGDVTGFIGPEEDLGVSEVVQNGQGKQFDVTVYWSNQGANTGV